MKTTAVRTKNKKELEDKVLSKMLKVVDRTRKVSKQSVMKKLSTI